MYVFGILKGRSKHEWLAFFSMGTSPNVDHGLLSIEIKPHRTAGNSDIKTSADAIDQLPVVDQFFVTDEWDFGAGNANSGHVDSEL